MPRNMCGVRDSGMAWESFSMVVSPFSTSRQLSVQNPPHIQEPPHLSFDIGNRRSGTDEEIDRQYIEFVVLRLLFTCPLASRLCQTWQCPALGGRSKFLSFTAYVFLFERTTFPPAAFRTSLLLLCFSPLATLHIVTATFENLKHDSYCALSI